MPELCYLYWDILIVYIKHLYILLHKYLPKNRYGRSAKSLFSLIKCENTASKVNTSNTYPCGIWKHLNVN